MRQMDVTQAVWGEKKGKRVIFGLKLDGRWFVHVICKTTLQPNVAEEAAWTTTVTKIIVINAGINIDAHKLALSIHQMNTALSHKDSWFAECRQLHTQLESIITTHTHTHTAQPSEL